MTGELQPYIALARRHPVLLAEQEAQLAKLAKRGDRRAADQLVMAHLRLVIRIARGYRGYGLPSDDLVSEGCIGLLHAVRKFDPRRGARLATVAVLWIRASMNEYVLRAASLVKIGTTSGQKRLFFKLRHVKNRLGIMGVPTPQQAREIARRLGVSPREVVEMDGRLGGDFSLDGHVNPSADGADAATWQDTLPDPAPDPEQQVACCQIAEQRGAALRAALRVLTDRERRILVARRLSDEPATLEALADLFGISRERVRQIEVRALERVRHGMVPEGRQSLDSGTGRT